MLARNKVKIMDRKTSVKHKKFKDDDSEERVEESDSEEASDDELVDSDDNAIEKSEDEEPSELKKELNKMSFEEVQKLQNKLGLKKYYF